MRQFFILCVLSFGLLACGGEKAPPNAEGASAEEVQQLETQALQLESSVEALEAEADSLKAALDALNALFPQE
jgi:outer membrane murein-binding lipoprotein Lpp